MGYVIRHISGFIILLIIAVTLIYIFSNVLGYMYVVGTSAFTLTSNALGYAPDSSAYSVLSTYGTYWSYTIEALLIGIVIAVFIGAARRRET